MHDRERRTEGLTIELSAEEVAALNDFQFRNRMPNRSAAFREVIRRGLLDAESDPPISRN